MVKMICSKKILSTILVFLLILSAIPLTAQKTSAASSATISNGEYYIKNVQSKRYVDIKNQTMANGTIIHQWQYHGHWTQRWKIELQSSGYHTISSVVSGTKYYLAVQNGSSSDGTPIVLKSGAVTSDMLWAISQTSLGYYKIVPKVGESLNRIMAVVYNSSQSTNGLQIKELTYSNDGHRSDEWLLLPALCSISPKHYYDTGFTVRNSSHTAANLVENSQTIGAERFLSIFGLYLSPTYESFTSVTDTCKFGLYGSISAAHLDTIACPHSPSCQTGGYMLTNLINRKGSSTLEVPRILWTGHRMSGTEDSFFDRGKKAIMITCSGAQSFANGGDGTIEEGFAFELLHEISHSLDAIDHYCNKTRSTDCSNPHCDLCVYGRTTVRTCVMSKYININDYSDQTLYCAECLIDIRLCLRNI